MDLDKLTPTLNKPKQGKIGFNPERDVDDKSLPYAKLQLSGKITDSDLAGDIPYSKLSLTDGDIPIAKTALGTYTPWTNITTYSGWAANPIIILRYTQIGKMVYVVGVLQGTSNASEHTITLPVAVAGVNEVFACISRQGVGDVYETSGIVRLQGGSTTASFFRYGDGTNFPATGTLAIWFQFFYEVV